MPFIEITVPPEKANEAFFEGMWGLEYLIENTLINAREDLKREWNKDEHKRLFFYIHNRGINCAPSFEYVNEDLFEPNDLPELRMLKEIAKKWHALDFVLMDVSLRTTRTNNQVWVEPMMMKYWADMADIRTSVIAEIEKVFAPFGGSVDIIERIPSPRRRKR